MQTAENPKVAEAVRKAYNGMGDTLYFDIAKGTHAVLYELPEERLNWLWYACYAVLCHVVHALLAASCCMLYGLFDIYAKSQFHELLQCAAELCVMLCCVML